MKDRVEFQMLVAYPPDREGRVVQLIVRQEGVIDIPAEIYRDGDQTMITLFSRNESPAWTYPLADFAGAVDTAVAALEAPGPRV